MFGAVRLGFLSQVPLSARFLLYRAVRGAWQRCGKAAQAQHNRTYISLAAWQDKQPRKGFTIATKFSRTVEGCVFSSHPRANLYKKGSPGVQKKKCCGRPRQRTAPQQQSTGILFSRNDIPKVSPQQFNRQSVLFANFACFYFKALLSHFVKDKF